MAWFLLAPKVKDKDGISVPYIPQGVSLFHRSERPPGDSVSCVSLRCRSPVNSVSGVIRILNSNQFSSMALFTAHMYIKVHPYSFCLGQNCLLLFPGVGCLVLNMF